MGHELDPEGGEHVEEGRLLVVAVPILRKLRLAVPVGAGGRIRLGPREQPAADDLRVGLQEREPIAVPVAGDFIQTGVREHAVERRVVGEERPRGAHEGIAKVVADAGKRAAANQSSGADLFTCAPDVREVRVAGRQPHLGPRPQGRPFDRRAALDVLLVRPCVVEEIELDQLHAGVLEVEQRPADTANVPRAQVQRRRVGRRVVVGPIHPGSVQEPERHIPAAAARRGLAHLSLKTLVAACRNWKRAVRQIFDTSLHTRLGAATDDECEARENEGMDGSTHSALLAARGRWSGQGWGCWF